MNIHSLHIGLNPTEDLSCLGDDDHTNTDESALIAEWHLLPVLPTAEFVKKVNESFDLSRHVRSRGPACHFLREGL